MAEEQKTTSTSAAASNSPKTAPAGLSLDKYRKAQPGQGPASLQQSESPISEQESKQALQDRIKEREMLRQTEPQLSQEEEQRNEQYARFVQDKNQYHQGQNFGYLDVFETEQRERKQAYSEFQRDQRAHQQQLEARKPAFFQKQNQEIPKKELTWREKEHEAHKKLKKSSEMNFDPEEKTHEELREFFKISKDQNALKDMNEKMFESTTQRMKTRSNQFYAFLNKQFNIMNFRSARCSTHCFDSPAKSLLQVHGCLQTCRQGITECRDFAHDLQKQSQQKLSQCVTEASDQKNMTDPIVHFISCYEQALIRYGNIEDQIEEEFSHFV